MMAGVSSVMCPSPSTMCRVIPVDASLGFCGDKLWKPELDQRGTTAARDGVNSPLQGRAHLLGVGNLFRMHSTRAGLRGKIRRRIKPAASQIARMRRVPFGVSVEQTASADAVAAIIEDQEE